MSPYTKEALEAQAKHWKEEAERQRRSRILQGVIGLIALGALISFTLWYTAHQQRVSDQRWCGLMVSFDNRYQQLGPNAAPEGVQLGRQIRQLREDLECTSADVLPGPTPSRRPS